jgi:hypothetical protein
VIIDQIKERIHKDFRPFVLNLSNGKRFEVNHPDFIAIGAKVVVVVDERSISHTINPVHVVTIEDIHPEPHA